MSNTNEVKKLDVTGAMVTGVVDIIRDELIASITRNESEITVAKGIMINAVCAAYEYSFTEAVKADSELGGEEVGAYMKVIHECNLLVAEIECKVNSLMGDVVDFMHKVEETTTQYRKYK